MGSELISALRLLADASDSLARQLDEHPQGTAHGRMEQELAELEALLARARRAAVREGHVRA